jgi:hypothetical protein
MAGSGVCPWWVVPGPVDMSGCGVLPGCGSEFAGFAPGNAIG